LLLLSLMLYCRLSRLTGGEGGAVLSPGSRTVASATARVLMHELGTIAEPRCTINLRFFETNKMTMEPPARPSSALFDVFLRLRPSHSANARFLTVEDSERQHPTHITIKPPTTDNRKRAVERFAFTRVFEEDAQQAELFKASGVVPMIEGVLGAPGHHGRDGLLATLGVTGSGKVQTLEKVIYRTRLTGT
jgi:hypothetical protein